MGLLSSLASENVTVFRRLTVGGGLTRCIDFKYNCKIKKKIMIPNPKFCWNKNDQI